jgi:mono/diheme cytochrome c family protein
MRFSFAVSSMAAAVVALGACGGDKPANAPTTDSTAPATTAAPAPADSGAPLAAAGNVSMEKGQEIYGRCMACHQQNGNGMPGAFPPLAGSEWVTGPVSRPIAVVLHGLQGEITVNGAKYNSIMMAYGTGAPMTDEEVASVLTYVRASFGNTASAVTVEDVAKVRTATAGRTTPMSQKDLEALQ